MIINFSSKLAQSIYDGSKSRYARRLPSELHDKACRLLDQINVVKDVNELRSPPSNHLEKLAGNLRGYWSLRINKQWRVIFRWERGSALDVDIVDYH